MSSGERQLMVVCCCSDQEGRLGTLVRRLINASAMAATLDIDSDFGIDHDAPFKFACGGAAQHRFKAVACRAQCA